MRVKYFLWQNVTIVLDAKKNKKIYKNPLRRMAKIISLWHGAYANFFEETILLFDSNVL